MRPSSGQIKRAKADLKVVPCGGLTLAGVGSHATGGRGLFSCARQRALARFIRREERA